MVRAFFDRDDRLKSFHTMMKDKDVPRPRKMC